MTADRGILCTDLTRAMLLAYLAPGDDVVRAAADHMLAVLQFADEFRAAADQLV